MLLILCILIGLCTAYISRTSFFLSTIGLLLSTTLFASALDLFTPWNLTIIFVILCGIHIFYFKHSVQTRTLEWHSIVVFAFFFAITSLFSFYSSDFVPEGERLRDFSLLSSTIQSPHTPKEPWMSGFGLNYYVFWYRVGALFATLGNLTTTVTYALLVSFCMSVYGTSIFLLCRRFLSFTLIGSFFSSIFMVFCSNIDGVLFAILSPKDVTWWGPSRIIKGAINEFPSWSLLHGDLHPHFMNLCAIPLSLLFTHSLILRKELISAFICAFILTPIFLFGSNAWETPFYLLIVSIGFVAFLFASDISSLKIKIFNYFSDLKRVEELMKIIFLGALTYATWKGCSHIIPLGDKFALVRNPILRTTTYEAFLHFGVPFSLITIANVFAVKSLSKKIFLTGCFLLALTVQDAAPSVILLLFTSFFLSQERSFYVNAIVISGLLLFIFPEVVFLNDNYGGENERMNTIFKVYCIGWTMLHLGGFALLKELTQRVKVPGVCIQGAQVACTCVFLLFFIKIFPERVRVAPSLHERTYGLFSVEKDFPGAEQLILSLKSLKKGIVIEAQGNPYSRTSFICTLSEQQCYLGWINHVDLLLKRSDESRRRNDVTTSVFSPSTSCAIKKEILEREKIDYVVFGPLERSAFPSLYPDSFECLTRVIESPVGVVYQTH